MKVRWQARIYGRFLEVVDGPECRWRWVTCLLAELYCVKRGWVHEYTIMRIERFGDKVYRGYNE